MLYLLSTFQEVMTYKNVVKYIGKKDESDYMLAGDFLAFKECSITEGGDGDQTTTVYYCVTETEKCPTFTTTTVPDECTIASNVEYAIPVESGYVVDFNRSTQATKFIKAIASLDDYEVSELVLGGKLSEEGKTAMQVIYCIMFWVIFALVIATFVRALLSICNCGCCRCCNSIKSIFPRNQA